MQLINKREGRIYNFLLKTVVSNSIKNALKTIRKSKISSPTEIIDFLFSKKGKYFCPWQHKEEIIQLAELINKQKPKVVLEIGTASGGTLFLSSFLADPNALIISIDLKDGQYGGGYPAWKIPVYKSFARSKQKIELIQGDSHSEEVFDSLLKVLNGKKIDYLFIDADHTYEGVKIDFEKYSTLLNNEALVAFHDIVSDKSEIPNHFVNVYWNEIKMNYPFKEFIKDQNQSKLGLGVLEINKTVN